MTSGIYRIKNDRTGEVYIGQSNNIEKRWEQHKEELKNRTHHNSGLQDDYNHGDTFSFEIIEEVNNKQEREDKEIIYIQRENSFLEGYNQTLGGGYDEKRGEMGYGGRLYRAEEEPIYEREYESLSTSASEYTNKIDHTANPRYYGNNNVKSKQDHTKNPRYYGDNATKNYKYTSTYNPSNKGSNNDSFMCCVVVVVLLFIMILIWMAI